MHCIAQRQVADLLPEADKQRLQLQKACCHLDTFWLGHCELVKCSHCGQSLKVSGSHPGTVLHKAMRGSHDSVYLEHQETLQLSLKTQPSMHSQCRHSYT